MVSRETYLILDVRPVTELVDPHREHVLLALLNKLCDIKLRWVSRALAIAHFPPIHPDMESGIDALESQSQLVIFKIIKHSEADNIRTALIVRVRRVWQVDVKRILHVRVVWPTSEALQLPHPRHINLDPLRAVERRLLEAFRCLEGTVGEAETPLASGEALSFGLLWISRDGVFFAPV